jgi:hypothetical protein
VAIYVGEAITIKADAVNPSTGQPISDATAVAEFYAPGKDPKNIPEDRTTDKPNVTLTYDFLQNAYVGFVSTENWESGKWSYRVRITGALYDSWEYGAFTLKP